MSFMANNDRGIEEGSEVYFISDLYEGVSVKKGQVAHEFWGNSHLVTVKTIESIEDSPLCSTVVKHTVDAASIFTAREVAAALTPRAAAPFGEAHVKTTVDPLLLTDLGNQAITRSLQAAYAERTAPEIAA